MGKSLTAAVAATTRWGNAVGGQDMRGRDADLGQERMRASAAVNAHEADTTAVPPTIEIQPITSRLARVRTLLPAALLLTLWLLLPGSAF